jgi:hypothetical protein
MEKDLKQIIKNEIAPLLIGIRNDLEDNRKATLELGEEVKKKSNLEYELEVDDLDYKGQDGYNPVPDKDYPSEKTVFNFIKDNLPQKGKDYFTNKDIKDIIKEVFLLMPNKEELKGRDGQIDYSVVESLAIPIIDKKYKAFKKDLDFVTKEVFKAIEEKKIPELTASKIRDRLESLSGNDRLSAKAIKGLEKFVGVIVGQSAGGGGFIPTLQQVTDNGSTTTNTITSPAFVTTGGTSDDFVKGDGSLDSNIYLTSEDLSSTLTIYPTTVASDIGGYFKLVTTPLDPDYDEPAVDVATGVISGTDQLIASLVTDAGILVGDLGIFTVTTIGNIRKVGGATTSRATFHFEIHKRDAGGTEELIAISSETTEITNTIYEQFFVTALFNDGTFLATDRIVLKFCGTKVGGGSAPSYEFQFGGMTPVRTLIPAPVEALLSNYVPYTDATKDVDLGIRNIKQATSVSTSSPTFTYSSGQLTNITYSNGTTKDFTYNIDDTLSEIVITYPDLSTVTKTLVWSSGVLQSINIV